MNVRLVLTFALSTLAYGCAGEGTTQNVDIEEDPKADASKAVNVGAGDTVNVTLTTSGSSRAITVDCGVDSDPDVSGLVFTVAAPDLKVTATSSPARDGYWRWAGDLAAGKHVLTIKGKTGGATCKVTSGAVVTASCAATSAFHSANTDHTHYRVTSTPPGWESFPASGNHWGSWAAWDTVYTKPVERPFMIHDMEHGGIVLSYNCSSPDESSDCKQAASDLEALYKEFGKVRVIVTPDPKQPTRYAARAWRWGFQSDCFDHAGMKAFMTAHFRHGREDIDASPPLPYDPTTTNVPCQDLMAAPDSCN